MSRSFTKINWEDANSSEISGENTIVPNLGTIENVSASRESRIEVLDISSLVLSPLNFYSITDEAVLEMSESIAAYGLKQPLEVMDNRNGTYEVIGGATRFMALKRLVEAEEKEEYRFIPCIVKPFTGDENLKILEIIECNRQRVKTPYDLAMETEKISNAIQALNRDQKSFSGRTRDYVAEILRCSKSEVGRRTQLSRQLVPEIKEGAFKENRISEDVALYISQQPQSIQENLAGQLASSEEESFTKNEVKALVDACSSKGSKKKSAHKPKPTVAPEWIQGAPRQRGSYVMFMDIASPGYYAGICVDREIIQIKGRIYSTVKCKKHYPIPAIDNIG